MIAIHLDKDNPFTAITPAILGHNIYEKRGDIIGFAFSLAWFTWSIDLEYYYDERR